MANLVANGSSDWVPAKGPFHLHLSGDFGGGTIQLEYRNKDAAVRSIANGSFTAAVDKLVSTGFNTDVRVTLSGASSPDLAYDLLSHAP